MRNHICVSSPRPTLSGEHATINTNFVVRLFDWAGVATEHGSLTVESSHRLAKVGRPLTQRSIWLSQARCTRSEHGLRAFDFSTEQGEGPARCVRGTNRIFSLEIRGG